MAPDSGESKHPLGTMCNDYFSKITGRRRIGKKIQVPCVYFHLTTSCGRAHATSASPPLCVKISFVTLLGSCSFRYREHRLPHKQLIEHFGNSVKFCNSVAMGAGPRKAGFDVNDGGPDAPLSPPCSEIYYKPSGALTNCEFAQFVPVKNGP